MNFAKYKAKVIDISKMCPRKKQLKKGMTACFVAFFLCGLVGLYKHTGAKDPLDIPVFTCEWLGSLAGERGVYSIWPCTHTLLYILLGFVAPSWWWLWLVGGVIWEGLEYGASLCIVDTDSPEGAECRERRDQYGEKWMQARVSDLFFNAAGLAVGLLLARYWGPEEEVGAKITYWNPTGTEDETQTVSST